MEQDIETCSNLYFLGTGSSVHEIDNTECWLECPRGDTGLEGPGWNVENGSSRGLRSGTLRRSAMP